MERKKNKILRGYELTYSPKNHRADTCGYVPTHVLVMEEKLGRDLRKGEIVHHKDKNKLNNKPENLVSCKNNKEHQNSYHKKTDEDKRIFRERMIRGSKGLDRSYPRHYIKTRLQHNSNRFTLTIPPWYVEKVLCAKKGDKIKFDQEGGKLILTKEE